MNQPSIAPGPQSLAPSSMEGSASEERQAAAAISALLAGVYRLFKVARMYDSGHQMLRTETEVAATAVAEFCTALGSDSADLVFVGETVFVNGQMPRFSRDAYARAMELAGLLDRCGISNLTIAKTVTPFNLLSFVTVVADVLRDASRLGELTSSAFQGLRARRLRARIGGDAAELDQSPAARVVRTYACAIVVLRGFYASLAREEPKLPAALRRVAQRIVTHSEQEPVLLVGLAAGKVRERDEATTATGTALVAVLMARQITSDRNALTTLVLAAMLHDVGRQQIFKSTAGDSLVEASMRTLSEEDQDRLAGNTALGVAMLDRIEAASVPRAVVAFEAHWMRRAQRLGAIYRGKRPASALARILTVARSFCELMAPGPYTAPMAAEDAVQFLSSRAGDESERTFVKLLTGALGMFPPGTTVELNTREIGVVTSVPEQPVDFSRPPVRVMYDASGNKLDPPIDVDLAAPPEPGQPQRMIQRTFDADQQQAQAMRAYVLAVTSGQKARRERAAAAGPPPAMPGSDSRSGKRAVAATREAPPPAFDDRLPTGIRLEPRRGVEVPDRPAFEERPPTGAGLDSRPRVAFAGADARATADRSTMPVPPRDLRGSAPPSRGGADKSLVPPDLFAPLDERPPVSLEGLPPLDSIGPKPSSPALPQLDSTGPKPSAPALPSLDSIGPKPSSPALSLGDLPPPASLRPAASSPRLDPPLPTSSRPEPRAFDHPELDDTFVSSDERPALGARRTPVSSSTLEEPAPRPSSRRSSLLDLRAPPSGRLPPPVLEKLQAIEELPLLEEIPGAETAPPQRDVPPTSSGRLSTPALDERSAAASGRVSIPAARESSPVSKRGAWKARQAERPKVVDLRAERESDSPPAGAREAGFTPPAPASVPAESRPALSPRVPAPRASAPAAVDKAHTIPTQPRLDRAAVLEALGPHDRPTPPSRPAARPASESAGTRKAKWSDYDEIVDEATPPPEDVTPPPRAPVSRPGALASRAEAPVSHPAAPSSRPETPTSRPGAPQSRPEGPSSRPVRPARPAPVYSGSVAGTRKVTWGDYDALVDELVEESGKKPTEAEVPSSGSPNMTRRATWEETEGLARHNEEDEPPEDEGI